MVEVPAQDTRVTSEASLLEPNKISAPSAQQRTAPSSPETPFPWSLAPQPLRLNANEVHVWSFRLDAPSMSLASFLSLLSQDEHERARRFHFDIHRNRFVVGRAMLRLLLSRYLQIPAQSLEFNYGHFGKPALAGTLNGTQLRFNLAHSDELALVAITRTGEIGVDLERVRPPTDMNELVARFFSSREARQFQKLPLEQKPIAFFNLWTRKEAWLKATGQGIGHLLNQVEVSFLPGERARLLTLPESLGSNSKWSLHELSTGPGFVASLAVARERPQIICRNCGDEDLLAASLIDGHPLPAVGARIPDRINRFSHVPALRDDADAGAARENGDGKTPTNPPIAILGVPFDNVTTGEALQAIEHMVASRQPHYIVTANVDFLVQAQSDIELRRILIDADLVLCDGTPLLWAAKLLGNPLPERVAGADLVPLLIHIAARRKYRLFFLGATPDSADHAVANLKGQYPDLLIAGHYSPPFAHLLEMDHAEITKRILAAQPDILFVSFGCPKQEKWIAMHYRQLGVPVAIGVGATIDFLAGTVKRAPLWMQRSGTEWLFRLAQEPRRLFRRYAKDLRVFATCILNQWWQLRSSPTPPPHDSTIQRFNDSTIQRFTLPARLDIVAVRGNLLPVQQIVRDGHDCLLAIHNVEFVDSTGMGVLIQLRKKLRSIGRELVLVGPTAAVRESLKLMGLDDFFLIAPDDQAATHLLKMRTEELASAVELTRSQLQPLQWQGEITASNAEDVWLITRDYLETSAASAKHNVIIDLWHVRFIDSSGLAVMVRARKLARRNGANLVFRGVQSAVQNVLRLSRMEEFILADSRAYSGSPESV